jgi:hypothetical protein
VNGARKKSTIENPHFGRDQLHGKNPLGHAGNTETPSSSLLHQSRENLLVTFFSHLGITKPANITNTSIMWQTESSTKIQQE